MLGSTEDLKALLEQIAALNEAWRQANGLKTPQKLAPPAAEWQIEAVEKNFRLQLPSDYAAFLRLHDGWQSFMGDMDLLSSDQMYKGPTFEWLQELKHIQREAGDVDAAAGFVIAASENGTGIVYLDRQTARGEYLATVAWDNEELHRHGSFTAYLRSFARTLQTLLGQDVPKETDY